ncbi:enterobactin transporter EntS [Gephyromycinifex aptenodytis]|uniref:enterobactin transporter EntS n=1 Tax=Gephyromycinifex aptenodytis TaxID=2716227 RepID=UPI001445FB8C|nr:enterobactin transporter EntS [Gephyromycinifex aptenodytis]
MRGLLDPDVWVVDLTPLKVNDQYRLLFAGRLISTFALGMLMVVLTVQTYDLTDSSLQVALVNTVLGLSTLVGSFIGGVLADRVDRRRVILVSRALAVVGFVALAVNAAFPEPSVAVLYLFAVWDGVTGAAGAAAFGAAVPAVVEPAMLPATGALMALSVDLGAAASPLVAGLLAGYGSQGLVYWAVAGVSGISWLLLVRLRPLPPDGGGPGAAPIAEGLAGWGADLVEGVTFAGREPVVAVVLVLGFLQILLASPHVLIPELVEGTIGGGPQDVGLIFSATSVGALVATTASGWVPRVRRVGVVLGVVLLLGSLGIAAFGLAPTIVLAVSAMFFVGACDVIAEILRFTILAERTPDRLRGRVQSLWSAQVTVGDSLGGPLLSLVARGVGVPFAIAAGGLLAAAGTAVLLTRPALRTLVRDPESSGALSGDPPELGEPRPPTTA